MERVVSVSMIDKLLTREGREMIVKELIEHLKSQDQEAVVVTSGYEGGYRDVDGTEELNLVLNVPRYEGKWYYGPHDYPREYDAEEMKMSKTKCLYLC